LANELKLLGGQECPVKAPLVKGEEKGIDIGPVLEDGE
jgi:hypothetical protein